MKHVLLHIRISFTGPVHAILHTIRRRERGTLHMSPATHRVPRDVKREPRILIVIALLVACIASSAPAAHTTIRYSRAQFKHWVDVDRDCQNTRAEVLIRDSEIPVTFRRPPRRCTVDRGRWRDVYTGVVVTEARALDVDHVVPLRAAWDAGAAHWTPERRAAFANHLGPHHLVVTQASVNRRKGARTPAEWLPPDEERHVAYATWWVDVKDAWELSFTASEVRALRDVWTAP